MKKIYEPLINEKNALLIEQFKGYKDVPQIAFAQVSFCEGDTKEYEAITISTKPVDFPFKDICPKDSDHLERKEKISKEKYPGIQKKYKGFIKRYYRLINQTIKYPKRLGYMLDEIIFYTNNDQEKKNNQVEWYLDSYVGNYENNLKTSHVLEYELYKLYIKDRKYHLNIKEKCGKEILKELPIRNYIHTNFENECDVLTSGKNRSSLLGVQVFVLIKNHSKEYDVLRIRRSENVVIKPGFLQFIPSGGFEAMNDCVDYDAQWDNYSITKAVFRELLEECFGQDEDDKRACGYNISPDRIYYNDEISKLIKKLMIVLMVQRCNCLVQQ